MELVIDTFSQAYVDPSCEDWLCVRLRVRESYVLGH